MDMKAVSAIQSFNNARSGSAIESYAKDCIASPLSLLAVASKMDRHSLSLNPHDRSKRRPGVHASRRHHVEHGPTGISQFIDT